MNKPIDLEIFPKTIYTDIVSIPDPCRLGFTFHYYNYSDQNLYFRLIGTGPDPWTGGSSDIGLVVSGTNNYTSLNNFMQRTKPTEETEEWIEFNLEAYSDAGYTDLVYDFSRACAVIFMDSSDGSWTLNELDDFDDLQECENCEPQDGWEIVWEKEGHGADAQLIDIVTDYILSSSLALKARYIAYYNGAGRERRWRLFKEFTTPDKDEVFAIVNFRWDSELGLGDCQGKYMRICWGDTQLLYIGRPWDQVEEDYIPRDRWMRFMVPLPKNDTDELRIILDINAGGYGNWHCFWIDDVKIISR